MLAQALHLEQRGEKERVLSLFFYKKYIKKAGGNAASLRLRGTKGSTWRETR